MRKAIFLFLFALIAPLSFSQPFTYEWTVQTAGLQQDLGRSVAVDLNGNVLNTGTFFDTIDIDPGPGIQQIISGGLQDTYIQKLDPNGNLVWGVSFTGNLAVVANEIVVDADGNSYLTGSFKGPIDFDTGPGTFTLTSVGQRDAFIAKLNADGELVWAKSVGLSGFERSFGLATDSQKNVYASGYFTDSIDFDPGPSVDMRYAGGYFDGFVLKLDSLGDYMWANTFDNDTISIALCLAVDENDEVYVGGYYANVMDFDPGVGVQNLASNGGNDIFLQKLDANGNLLWAITEGGTDDQSLRSIETDQFNNVYLTGGFEDTMDFDPGTNVDLRYNNGQTDIFVQKFSGGGEHQWVRTFGSSYSDVGRNITTDTLGYVYVTGNYADSVDFDPGPGVHLLTGDTLDQIFVMKLRQNGDFVWTDAIVGTNTERGYGIETDNNGSVYVTGFFTDTIDFDPSAGVDEFYAIPGDWDAFLTRFSQCIPTMSSIAAEACNMYTSPSGNYTWNTNGMYMDTLLGGNLCGEDSIIQINLTINTVDNTVTVIDELTMQANATGVSYQWLDCNNGYAPITGATGQTYASSTNGQFAVQVMSATCTDTSACFAVTTVGLEENEQQLFSLFPNPTNGEFQIVFGDHASNGTLEIRDIQGRLVVETPVSEQEMIVTLNGRAGYYFVTFTSEDGSVNTQKLMKK